ncbi:39S ribosomal protein L21, mitochondrial-like isoform X2 [Varroa destructor]|uniref:Large ribosomal subunit protein bL21m n=1 Tax=Varroa destructor TaxID=109461 RepID=A0A7M7KAV3_VARDE|nr:39S ribosomal protein L21, mitochondrial-like isoform X2 [Varroa destructor]XP_022663113.1 39S ribosomal protein L21, mitochondrial-like isoform X2 [Varroa destructor]XP_022663114.1 39S ribosomal protein L21, mitochondrial-like isoform X2 [Varroa destructor]
MFRRVLSSTATGLNVIGRNGFRNRVPITSKAGVATAGPVHRGEIVDEMRDYRIVDDVIGAINRQITEDTYSRLFAVVFINGKQFKVTAEDMIAIQAHLPVEIGETISLEKILLVGGTDFSIIGRPLIDKTMVRVLATVVEKTLNYEYRRFLHIQRTRLHRSYFFRDKYMVLRINGIQLLKTIDP